MNWFISRVVSGRVAIALICVCSLLLSASSAQTQSPSTTPPVSLTSTADEVNKAGYSLKDFGLATNSWPVCTMNFSIKRADQTIFKNLTLADVQPKVDGKPLLTREGDLVQKDGAGGVFVLLDGSGSMVGSGVDKLTAAKQSLETLIDKLNANTPVGLIVFDEEPRVIIAPTTDKTKIKQEIESFTIRPDKSRYTRLYEAVKHGLQQAKDNGIKNLLVISDGWEDTPETRALAPDGLANLKRAYEEEITNFSRKNHIRVFSVAIGDEHGQGLNYVDRLALDNISKGANGGVAAYIELKGDLGSRALEQTFLLSRLQQILDDLKQWFEYSYSLTVRVDESMQIPGREHKLWIGFTVGDDPRIQLPIEYTYVLQAKGEPPVVIEASVQQPVFIRAAPRNVTWQQLLTIYVLLLFVLAVLAIVPSIFKALSRGGQALRLRKSIVTIAGNSALVGVACPNEGTAAGRVYLFKEGDAVLICPNCKTPHHLSCWTFNDHQCMKRTCAEELVVPASVLESLGLSLAEETSWMTS
jgi:hypothetical protein